MRKTEKDVKFTAAWLQDLIDVGYQQPRFMSLELDRPRANIGTVNYEIGNLIRWRKNFGNMVLIMFCTGHVQRTALEWRLLYGRIFKVVVILLEQKNVDLVVEEGKLDHVYKPKVMDCALLRPRRLGKLLYVHLSSPTERRLILKELAKKKPIDAIVDLVAFGKNDSCSYLSGADLATLMDEATMVALQDKLQEQKSSDGTRYTIKTKHYYGRLQQSLSPACQPDASGITSFV